MTSYPEDSEFRFLPVFTGTVKKGDVLADSRDVTHQVRVIADPEIHINLIGRPKRIVRLTVSLIGMEEETVELLYPASEVIFQRRFVHSPSHPETDPEL